MALGVGPDKGKGAGLADPEGMVFCPEMLVIVKSSLGEEIFRVRVWTPSVYLGGKGPKVLIKFTVR